uniref:Uncharacterized protein n=1 Tax=viral metagenome TaxID=1070528 RepID=A0A6C0E3G6_9ZZZZ
MANIFTLENTVDFTEKINIDSLYEKKQQMDLNKLELFNKILNRIHVKIKTISRQKIDEQFCWYVVPEIIIGVPKYDQGTLIAYLIDKLKTNGFIVRYYHPNTIFICWKHWVPSYVRNEIKSKTGIVLDEYGKKVTQDHDDTRYITNNDYSNGPNGNNTKNIQTKPKDDKKYTPINSYKPSGKLIYNDELFDDLENKIRIL